MPGDAAGPGAEHPGSLARSATIAIRTIATTPGPGTLARDMSKRRATIVPAAPHAQDREIEGRRARAKMSRTARACPWPRPYRLPGNIHYSREGYGVVAEALRAYLATHPVKAGAAEPSPTQTSAR
jgi:hypothetical protein